jgi:hypothetical protein
VVGRRWREMGKRIAVSAVCLMLLLNLLGCSPSSSPNTEANDTPQGGLFSRNLSLEEVSPPEQILQLRRSPSSREPQVKIVGLKPNATLDQTTASIRFEVEDFPIFKDPELNLGPHLDVLLDDQPYAEVYDAKQSIVFSDLKPGTHTVRVFASRPWHESVKTPSAFDQLTFHVFAPTQANRPPLDQPLLTYSQPHGTYGAEPILLDYLLTPPSGETKGSESTALPSSKVRVTVNGTSFTTEEQPPIYLKGFKPGENWVKVELLNSSGKAISNDLDETVQIVTLNPGGNDTLSKLVRGALNAKDAEQIVSLEASQRRAAQRLEALSAPQPTPVLKATEESAETKSNSLLPIPASSPAKSEISSSRPSGGVPRTPERIVPIPMKKPETVRPESPTAEPNSAAKVFEKGESKPVPSIEAPIQSFLKRFRQPDVAPPTAPSLLPKEMAPALDTGNSSRAENGNPPSIPPKPPASSVTVTPQIKGPDAVQPIFEPENKRLPLEKTPEIPWRKFLNLRTGEDSNKPAAVELPEQSTIPSRYSKAADPQGAMPNLGSDMDPIESAKP